MQKQETSPHAQNNPKLSVQNEIALIGLDTPPRQHDNENIESKSYSFAELEYKNGIRIAFSYDEISKDYSLIQEGRIGENYPVLRHRYDTLLQTYLLITPGDLPIPEELLEEGAKRKDFTEEIKNRGISSNRIDANQLDLRITAGTTAAAQYCGSTYYSWWDWHDAAIPGMIPKAYYASSFGGKKRYTDSYVLNCSPNVDWIWARHRIYYKDALGKYRKQFDGKVPGGTWQAASYGSIKRWRRVIYDDSWDSHPGSGNLLYTREGRFDN